MQVFNDKLFINPIKIIKAFDKKTFLEAFCLIEYYKKSNFYLIGYIKYETYNFLLEINNDYKSKLPLLYFEVYKKYQKYKYDIKGNEKIHIVTIENIDKNKYISNINQIKDYIKKELHMKLTIHIQAQFIQVLLLILNYLNFYKKNKKPNIMLL